ncbi:hypothetical protein BH23PLA1_BH23PLA1_36310 [soil metagenome]
MHTYFFDLTIRLRQDGRRVESVLYRGARAENELAARRIVLNRLLDGGFQVSRLDLVPERTQEPEPEGI